jgi:hypothetical protein
MVNKTFVGASLKFAWERFGRDMFLLVRNRKNMCVLNWLERKSLVRRRLKPLVMEVYEPRDIAFTT